MGNRKSLDQSSRTRAPTKTTKSESFPRVWRGKVTKERGTRSSCVTPAPNLAKKRLQNSATKIPRKGSENHQKGKTGETQPSLEEPRRIIYTYQSAEGPIRRTREGGSEWEPIKFFSKEMKTPTRRTRLPTHVSDSLPRLVKPT
jgi:hypothetical protein